MAVIFQLLSTGQHEDKAFHTCFITRYLLKPLIKSDNKANKQKRSCEFFSLAVIMWLLVILIKKSKVRSLWEKRESFL